MDFQSLNPQFGNYTGHGYITHYQQQFWPHFKIYGPASPVQHRQFIHAGNRCPESTDDKNRDGYLDYDETLEVVGGVLIPLANSLNPENLGSSHYPRIKQWHDSYYYSATSNSRVMMRDFLKRESRRIGPYDLSLDQRVIVVYGAWSETQLALSLATHYGFSPQEEVPVACAKIIFRGNFASKSLHDLSH